MYIHISISLSLSIYIYIYVKPYNIILGWISLPPGQDHGLRRQLRLRLLARARAVGRRLSGARRLARLLSILKICHILIILTILIILIVRIIRIILIMIIITLTVFRSCEKRRRPTETFKQHSHRESCAKEAPEKPFSHPGDIIYYAIT